MEWQVQYDQTPRQCVESLCREGNYLPAKRFSSLMAVLLLIITFILFCPDTQGYAPISVDSQGFHLHDVPCGAAYE